MQIQMQMQYDTCYDFYALRKCPAMLTKLWRSLKLKRTLNKPSGLKRKVSWILKVQLRNVVLLQFEIAYMGLFCIYVTYIVYLILWNLGIPLQYPFLTTYWKPYSTYIDEVEGAACTRR